MSRWKDINDVAIATKYSLCHKQTIKLAMSGVPCLLQFLYAYFWALQVIQFIGALATRFNNIRIFKASVCVLV